MLPGISDCILRTEERGVGLTLGSLGLAQRLRGSVDAGIPRAAVQDRGVTLSAGSRGGVVGRCAVDVRAGGAATREEA